MKPASNRLFLIDAAVIVLASVAISLAASQLTFMTVFIPALILARLLAIAAVAKTEGTDLKAELVLLLICTLLGAFNDWNSVCNKKIYDYTVPTDLSFSTIPLWMLLYWGMILRFIARLARWAPLAPSERISNTVGRGSWIIDNAAVKVSVELLLVLGTRQMIYRFYLDPLLSWIPFLGALAVYPLLFGITRHDLKLLGIFLIGGPAIEILYIQAGGLHQYHLAWLAGVPLWIALWWLVIVLIWKDLAYRIETGLRKAFRKST